MSSVRKTFIRNISFHNFSVMRRKSTPGNKNNIREKIEPHTHKHAHTQTQTETHTETHRHIHTHTHKQTHTHTHTHENTQTYTRTYKETHTHTGTQRLSQTYIHSHTRTRDCFNGFHRSDDHTQPRTLPSFFTDDATDEQKVARCKT